MFSFDDDTLVPLDKNPFGLEKDIQVLVESNLETLFSLQFVSTEFTITDFRLDTLAFDEQANALCNHAGDPIVVWQSSSVFTKIGSRYDFLLWYEYNFKVPRRQTLRISN